MKPEKPLIIESGTGGFGVGGSGINTGAGATTTTGAAGVTPAQQ
jgi:hypothetical protein